MEDILSTIQEFEGSMVQTLCDLVDIPAVSPLNGGQGERKKAEYLLAKLNSLGFGSEEFYNSPDDRVECGYHPNLVARIKGRTARRVWFVSHMDVVPEGDISLWDSDPFKALVRGKRIYGRGTSDNGQEIVSSLYAAAALKELGFEPEYEICLCFVSDEEVGSEHGICHLLEEEIFSPDDLIYVPDSGSLDGSFIEIAEKSNCAIEFVVEGRQVHASVPERGINACRVANELSFILDSALHEAFPESDPLFSPPISTFEPTRRNLNVQNSNTIPGREVFSFDCRVLPSIPFEKIEELIAINAEYLGNKHGAKISWTFPRKDIAPAATPVDAPVVTITEKAIKEVLKVEPRVGGIGGGTCASFFRKAGMPAVVWRQGNDTAHQPNEFIEIEHMVNEAKVFACIMCGI